MCLDRHRLLLRALLLALEFVKFVAKWHFLAPFVIAKARQFEHLRLVGLTLNMLVQVAPIKLAYRRRLHLHTLDLKLSGLRLH